MKVYVYVYYDPGTKVVRYVGSGTKERLAKHTCADYIGRQKGEYYEWIKSFGDDFNWNPHRAIVAGPMSEQQAHQVELELILEHFDTVFNKRCPVTHKWLKPFTRTKTGPYGPRSESGRQKLYRKQRWEKAPSPLGTKSGCGIGRHGNGWRATFTWGNKRLRKGFPTYCEALKQRLAWEKEFWPAT